MARRSNRIKALDNKTPKRKLQSNSVSEKKKFNSNQTSLSKQNTTANKITARLQDWRADCQDIRRIWSRAQEAGQFCDIRLSVGPEGSVEYFNVHKIFLACASPVFEAMFYGELAAKDDCVPLPGDDPEAFRFLISHAYGQDVFFPTFRAAVKTYALAEKYLIPDLQSRACNGAKLHLNDGDFWEVIKSDLFSNASFKDICMTYLSNNAQRLLKLDSFFQVPKDIVEIIVKMNVLEIQESDLLTAVTRWCYKNITDRRKRKPELQKMLNFIRFSNMSISEFSQFMDEFPDAIDCRNSLAIMKHFGCKLKYPLPSWCTTNKEKRSPYYRTSSRDHDVSPDLSYSSDDGYINWD